MLEDKILSYKRIAQPLLWCHFFTHLGDSFLRTVLVLILTFHSTVSAAASTIIVTTAMVLFTLPFCFASTIGLKIGAHANKVRNIRSLQLVNLAVALLSALAVWQGNYQLLLVSIFLSGIHASLFWEMRNSMMPDNFTEKNEYKMWLITLAAVIVGMVLASIVVGCCGHKLLWQALLISLIPLASVISAFRIRVSEGHQFAEHQAITLNFIKENINCLRRALRSPHKLHALQGIAWFWLLTSIFISQLPSLNKQWLHCDGTVLVTLMVIFISGFAGGTVMCQRILKSQMGMHLVPTAMLAISWFIFDILRISGIEHQQVELQGLGYLAFNPHGRMLCFDFFFMAAAGGLYLMPIYQYLQLHSNKPYRFQIRIAHNLMNALFIIVGSLVTILLNLFYIKSQYVIMLLGFSNLLTALYICRLLPNTVVKNLFRIVLKLFYRVEVNGMQHFKHAGHRVLIIANHASSLDPLIISAFLPGRLYFAVDSYIARSWWLAPFMWLLNAKPIEYTNSMAAKTIIDKLKARQQVVIFPEGRITVTGSLMKVYDSPGVIAEKAGAILLPIKLEGTHLTWFSKVPGKVRFPLFPKIKMTIMPPCRVHDKLDQPSSSRERRHVLSDRLYDIMSQMMFHNTYPNDTLVEALLEAKNKFGRSHLIADDINKTKMTYGKLLAGAIILGKKIRQDSALGDKIGIMLPNMCGTVITLFAMMFYGRIPAMLNFSFGIYNILSCCRTAKIKTIYTSRSFLENADLTHLGTELADHGLKVIYIEDLRKQITILDKLSGLYKSFFSARYYCRHSAISNIGPNSEALVLFTSGSEGAPKGVVLSHANIIANLQQVSSLVDLSANDRLFNAMPIFHTFGLTIGAIMPLLQGIFTFFYPSPLHYRVIPEFIYNLNITVFFGTDTFLCGYAQYAHPYDFFSVRYVFAGAEKLKDETRKLWMDKFGIRVLEGYGATEASPVISINTPMHYKANTAGRLLPAIKWMIEPVPGISHGGKLLISGPNIMQGYLKIDNPGVLQHTEAEIDGEARPNWYDTGDIVYIDDENYLTVCGRLKRFAKIGGEMVSLTAVEEAIQQLWPDQYSAAVASPHPKKGETITVFTENLTATRQDLISHFRFMGLPELYCPSMLRPLEMLPRLGNGKVDYISLEKEASEMTRE